MICVMSFRQKLPEVADKISFYIGDVRDIQSIKSAMHGVDYIFHAAALKQVPSCEFFPIEAVKTNVLGTENVLTAAIDDGVETVICLINGQGCLSGQRNGYFQGHDGKSHCGEEPHDKQNKNLLHPIWKCYV